MPNKYECKRLKGHWGLEEVCHVRNCARGLPDLRHRPHPSRGQAQYGRYLQRCSPLQGPNSYKNVDKKRLSNMFVF